MSAVNHPDHYNGHPSGIECIDIIEELPCNTANAFKYLWRYEDKEKPRQDLEKCLWYLKREWHRFKHKEFRQRRVVSWPASYREDLYVMSLVARVVEAEPDRDKGVALHCIAMGSFRTYYLDKAAEAVYKMLQKYDNPDEARARAQMVKHTVHQGVRINYTAAGIQYRFTKHWGVPDFYTDGQNIVEDLAIVERCLLTFRKA